MAPVTSFEYIPVIGLVTCLLQSGARLCRPPIMVKTICHEQDMREKETFMITL